MSDVEVTCRVCGHTFTPTPGDFRCGEWRAHLPCRAAVREHAQRAMQRLGYAPPHPERPNHDALLHVWDERWKQQLTNAERFLTRVHELDREQEDAP